MKRTNQNQLLSLVVCLLFSTTALSFQWQDLWETKDHQAQTMMEKGLYTEAEQTFKREDWRAAAAFRAKDYQKAASLYALSKQPDADYNAGNAFAHMGQYPQAIQAYDKALKINPKNADASYNRKIVEALLKKQSQNKQPEQKPKSDTPDQNQPNQDKSNQSGQNQQNPNQSDSKSNQDQSHQTNQKDPSNQDQQHPSDQTHPKDPDQQDENKQEPTKPTPSTEQTKQNQADSTKKNKPLSAAEREQQLAKDQWLHLIPDDPGGLLREKFLRDYLRRRGEPSP